MNIPFLVDCDGVRFSSDVTKNDTVSLDVKAQRRVEEEKRCELESQIENLRHQLFSKEQRIAECSSLLDSSRLECEKLILERNSAHSELFSARATIERLENDRSTVFDKSVVSEIEMYKQRVSELENTVEDHHAASLRMHSGQMIISNGDYSSEKEGKLIDELSMKDQALASFEADLYIARLEISELSKQIQHVSFLFSTVVFSLFVYIVSNNCSSAQLFY